MRLDEGEVLYFVVDFVGFLLKPVLNLQERRVVRCMVRRVLIFLCYRVFSFAFTMFSALAPAHGTSSASGLVNGGAEGGGDGEHARRSPDQESGQVQPEDKVPAEPVVQNV